jgi:hypothetical protein
VLGAPPTDTYVLRLEIMWNPCKFGAWSSSLSLPAPSWWAGWSSVGLSTPIHLLPVTIRRGDRWTDFFLGRAQSDRRHSILDSKAKVALHYCASDLDQIAKMDCPSVEIPNYLWQQLKQQSPPAKRYSLTSQRFHG